MSSSHSDSAIVLSAARRRAVTAALMVGTFLGSLDVTVVGTAMPTIAGKLGGVELYGWVFSSYLLASTVTVPIYGRLADLWGRRPAYLLGLSIFLVGSLACGLSSSMPMLVAARLVQGLGAGALVPVTLVVVDVAVERRPPGFFPGPPPPGVVVCGAAGGPGRAPPRARGSRLDLLGAVVVSAATSCLLLGAKSLEEGGALRGLAQIAAGLALSWCFVGVERRAAANVDAGRS